MTRVLIVGIGNPFRSDDGVGWRIAQELSQELVDDEIQVMAMQQLTPEMSALVSQVERVVFVDAAASGEPGTLKCEPISPAALVGRHSHELSPAGVLKLAQDLYGRAPQGYLLTIAGASFETGDMLSDVVAATLPALKRRVRLLVTSGTDEATGQLPPAT